MNIFIKATGLELTEPIKTYIEEKVGSLERFLERFGSDAVKVQVEIARSTKHHRQGEIYRAEANMQLPHEVLRAEEDDADIRAAVDSVKDKLRREIESYLSRHGKEHRTGRQNNTQ